MSIKKKQKLLILSGLFSTDRIILHLEKLDLLSNNDVEIWTQNYSTFKKQSNLNIHHFSLDKRYNKFSLVRLLRKWYDKQFDYKHYSYFRRIDKNPQVPFIKLPDKICDRFISFILPYLTINNHFRSQFNNFKPDLVLSFWPYDMSHLNVISYAKRKKKITYAFITGFDNISTKSRMPSLYDKYFVWSTCMQKELLNWYPLLDISKVKIVGAPQFDILLNKNYLLDKNDFFDFCKLDLNLETILYCIGSPNLLNEICTFKSLFKKNVFKNYQVILRLHPGFRYEKSLLKYLNDLPNVIVHYQNENVNVTAFQDLTDIKLWVSSFYWSDIVINSSSTVCLDAAVFNKLIVNLNFELNEKGDYSNELICKINSNWYHLLLLLNHNCIIKVNYWNDLQNLFVLYDKINNDCSSLISTFFDDTLGKSSDLLVKELFNDV